MIPHYYTMPGLKYREPVHASPERVIGCVIRHFDITEAEIKGRSREPRLALPRMIAMSLVREYTVLTTAQVGALFHRDHTSVVYATTQVRALAKGSLALSAIIREIKESI